MGVQGKFRGKRVVDCLRFARSQKAIACEGQVTRKLV
jgi:hypothetical protein